MTEATNQWPPMLLSTLHGCLFPHFTSLPLKDGIPVFDSFKSTSQLSFSSTTDPYYAS